MPPCPWKAPAEAKGAVRKPVEFPEPSAPQRHQIVIWNKGASPKREPVTAGDARKSPWRQGRNQSALMGVRFVLQEKTVSIDNLTFGELKQIAAMFGSPQIKPEGLSAMVGKKCIVRTYSAGVWFGEIAEKDGTEVIVRNARRMWQWKAKESISLSAVAKHGIDQSGSKIAPTVDLVWLDAIELIPASAGAVESIEGAVDVKAQ